MTKIIVNATLDDDLNNEKVDVSFTPIEYKAIEQDQNDGNYSALADAISDRTDFCVLSINSIKEVK